MAEFTEELSKDSSNYLNYSGSQRANTAFGSLFAGLGDAVEQGVATADNRNIRNITQDITQGYDAINDSFGVTSGATIGGESTGTGSGALPNEVKEAETYLNRLTHAFESGAIKESHYWGRAETYLKGVRSRYPGYRQQIDDIAGGIFGSTPANALRNSLMNEINADINERASGANRDENFVRDNLEYMSPETKEKWYRGEAGIEEVIFEVADTQKREKDTAMSNAEITLLQKNGELTTENVMRNATGLITTETNETFSRAINKVGGNYSKILDYAAAALESDNMVDADEEAKIRELMGGFRFEVNSQTEKLLTEPRTPTGDSYATLLKGDKTQLDALRDIANKQVDLLENYLVTGQTALIGSMKAHLEAQKTQAGKELLDQGGWIRTLAAIETVGIAGNVADTIVLNTVGRGGGENALSSLSTALVTHALGRSWTGEPGSTLKKDVQALQQGGIVEEKAYIASINGQIESLLSPDVPLDVAANVGNYLFAPENAGFLAEFQPNDRIKILSKLASPEVSKKMAELRDVDGQTKLWENYESFVTDSFKTLFQNEIATIQGSATAFRGLTVTYENGQFKSEPSPGASAMQGGAQMIAGEKAIAKMNIGLQILKPIAEANGQPLETYAADVMAEMGLDLATERDDSLFKQMWDWLSGGPTGDTSGADAPLDTELDPDDVTLQYAPTPQQQSNANEAIDAMAMLDDGDGGEVDWSAVREGIANIESRGSGGYRAIGPETNGSHGYGKYQVMGYNVGPWTKKYLGREMTPQQFLNDPAAQEVVFQGEFGKYIRKYGLKNAAQAWFGGPGSIGKVSSTDENNMSVGNYSSRFIQGYTSALA